jgi:hypothetical protein
MNFKITRIQQIQLAGKNAIGVVKFKSQGKRNFYMYLINKPIIYVFMIAIKLLQAPKVAALRAQS